MKTQNKYLLFNHTGCLSKEQLIAYVKNQLTASQNHQVEQHLVDCELCSDAVDGFHAVAGSPILDETLAEVAALTAESPNSAGVNFKVWMYAASVLLILGFTTWFFLLVSKRDQKQVAEKSTAPVTTISPPVPVTDSIAKIRQEQPVYETNPGHENNKSVYQEEKPVTEELHVQKRETRSEASDVATDEVTGARIKSMDEQVSATQVAPEPALEEVTRNVKDSHAGLKNEKAVSVLYIEGLKTVYVDNALPATDSLIAANKQGVEARYENEAARKKSLTETGPVQHHEGYLSNIEKGIYFFKREAYNKAAFIFDEVLKDRPSDPNALFYGALSHFALGHTTRAEKYLSVILENRQHSFFEEARWNKALIDIEKGDTISARKLLELIVAEKGFYSGKAINKLKEIK